MDFLEVNTDAGDPATVVIDQDDELNSLIVFPGGTLRVTSGAVLCNSPNPFSGNVEFFVGGTMDLAGGALLSRAGLARRRRTFGAAHRPGRNGGAVERHQRHPARSTPRSPPHPRSSDGVGYGLGSQIAPTTIGPFSIAASDTLVRYTLDGDADLSGNVNLADFNRLAAQLRPVRPSLGPWRLELRRHREPGRLQRAGRPIRDGAGRRSKIAGQATDRMRRKTIHSASCCNNFIGTLPRCAAGAATT